MPYQPHDRVHYARDVRSGPLDDLIEADAGVLHHDGKVHVVRLAAVEMSASSDGPLACSRGDNRR